MDLPEVNTASEWQSPSLTDTRMLGCSCTLLCCFCVPTRGVRGQARLRAEGSEQAFSRIGF